MVICIINVYVRKVLLESIAKQVTFQHYLPSIYNKNKQFVTLFKEIEPCIESKCLNSGRCKSNNQTGCECPINFTGTYCEQEINHVAFKNSVTIRCDPNPCQNNGICFENILDNKKTIECLCPVSYSGKFCEKAGVTCEKCQNGGLCKVINSTTVTCECPRGLTGENCESDIDECQAKDACENKSACINTFGSFQCVCLPGYYGIKCEKNDNDVFIHQGTKCNHYFQQHLKKKKTLD